jgi:RND family efflux transporter MFP subunit
MRALSWTAALASIVFMLGCEQTPDVASGPRPVRVMRIQDAKIFSDRTLPGRAKATQEVNLAFRVAGPLIALPVNVGDQVKRGDTVARIDPRDFEVALRSAKANYDAARAQLKSMSVARPEEISQLEAAVDKARARQRTAANELGRAQPLVESRTITRSEFDKYLESKDRADAELRQAEEDLRIGRLGARPEDIEAKQAEIDSLRAAGNATQNQLNDTNLVAPFDGTIVAKYVENYEDVQAKQPIVRLLDSSRIEMVISVPESSISLVPYVTDVLCSFDAFPDLPPLPAKVKEIGTEASKSTRTYPVTLIMEQPREAGVEILPGMAGRAWGRVDMPANDDSQGIEIPATAVFSRDGKDYVWVVESADGRTGTTKLREVSRGNLSARGLSHVQGLKAGELIVTAGVHYLGDGQTVRILQPQPTEPAS